MRPRTSRSTGWRVPVGLLALSLVPALAGASRLGELASGAPATRENARFVHAPVPVVVHIVAALAFSLLGALQFAPPLRLPGRSWHRRAGRVVAGAGLAAAASGAWMTHTYDLPPADGAVLGAIRDAVAVAMAASIVLGVRAARRRRMGEHRAWMLRAYALGLGAGTQVVTHLPWFVLVGTPTEVPRTALMAAGWVINLAVAEVVLRRPTHRAAAGGHLTPVPAPTASATLAGAEQT